VYTVRRVVGQYTAKGAVNNVKNDSTRSLLVKDSGAIVGTAVAVALGRQWNGTSWNGFSSEGSIPCPADFGPLLERWGFRVILDTVRHEDGDVAVWSRVPTHDQGHVQVFFKNRWFSHYVQRHLTPWYSNEGSKPSFYRYFVDAEGVKVLPFETLKQGLVSVHQDGREGAMIL
jgi:hypothetical protein